MHAEKYIKQLKNYFKQVNWLHIVRNTNYVQSFKSVPSV